MDASHLKKIRGLIRRYASLISAADRMEQIDFNPKFQQCVDEVHHFVQRLPESFVGQHRDLIMELQKDGYHFSWSKIEDHLNELLETD